jgi:hypothetical protein
VYTATGDAIGGYIHNKKDSHEHFIGVWRTEPVAGYKLGAVRVVHWPKPFAEADRATLASVEWAHYGLCEVSVAARGPFEIQALYHLNGGALAKKGLILPPKVFPDLPLPQQHDWRNYPVGIAVDSVRLWVFGTSFLACVTHADVKRCLEREENLPPWSTYLMPADIAGYDPKEKAYMGLCDLSACDDGTLAAVFQDKGGARRIITATTRFEPNQSIIQPGKGSDGLGNDTPTHGWVMDKTAWAYRVHKQPIFCWSTVEGLEAILKPKPAQGAK